MLSKNRDTHSHNLPSVLHIFINKNYHIALPFQVICDEISQILKKMN